MHRNRSLPPNRQGRSTSIGHVGKLRASAAIMRPEQKIINRDVKSKGHLARATSKLIEFLESTEYPNALSPRILQSPNSKEVFCIFEHLVRQIDPTFRIEHRTAKVDEICLNALKLLGYPHSLSKQYLATPGAPHAWPSVLAALNWLSEEIESANELISSTMMFKIDDDQDADEEPLGKLMHQLDLLIFRHNHHDEPLKRDELEQYQFRLNRILGCPLPDDVKNLETHLNDIDTQLNSMNDLHTRETTLRNVLEQKNTDLKSLKNQKLQMEKELQQLEPLHCELQQQLSELEDKVRRKEEELRDVRAKVKEQEDAGYGHLAQEYCMLRERYTTRLQAKEDLTKEIEQMELAYSRREGKIAPALDAYNRLVGALMLPEYSAIGRQCNLKICSYRSNFDITKHLTTLIDDVRSCCDQYRTAGLHLSSSIKELNARIEKLQATINKTELADLQSKLNDFQAQLEKLDELSTEADLQHFKAEQQFVLECNELSKQLDNLRDELEKDKKHLDESQALLERRTQERVNLMNYLDATKHQLAVYTPCLQSLIEVKESADRSWNTRLNALRQEIRRGVNRIEQKVNSALSAWDHDVSVNCTDEQLC